MVGTVLTRTVTGFCLWFAAAAAWAGPPFVTDDADPPDVGQWEINLPFTLKRAADGSHGGEFVTIVNAGHVLLLSAGRSLRGDPDLALFLGRKILTPPSR